MFKSLQKLRRRNRPEAPPAAAESPTRAQRSDPERVLRQLEWTVIRRLDGLLHGDYRTLFRGFGLDFADLREYQPEDDVRYIDWNVTARTQIPHVREFQEDREISAWFLVDLSGSIDFGSQTASKRAIASEFVTVMARLLTRHGNRVGAILYSNGVDVVIPPRAGRMQVLHILDRMQKIADPATGKHTDLNELLARVQGNIKRRSVMFVVSDFISQPGWERGLSNLARRHEIIAVRLFDRLEIDMPDLGLVVMQDAETGEQIFVDTHDRAFRRRFGDAARIREAALRTALTEAGVDCLELATDDSVDHALLAFTRLRKRRSQLSGGGNLSTLFSTSG